MNIIMFINVDNIARKIMNNKQKFKNAFTLAEVLITIGIIGIVAAMTIPTLISNYQKQIVETNLQETYSIMQQVMKYADKCRC